MRVLVTGATGKVGSRLAMRLARRGDHVRALVRDPGRATDLREHGVEIVQGDLLDRGSLGAAVHGVDGVVHCAALYFHSAASEQGHAVNDLGTQRLAELARAAGVKRFAFISTGLVYGGNGGRLAGEDDVCAPEPGFFASKLAVEQAFGVHRTAARPTPHVVGIQQHQKFVIRRWIPTYKVHVSSPSTGTW